MCSDFVAYGRDIVIVLYCEIFQKNHSQLGKEVEDMKAQWSIQLA